MTGSSVLARVWSAIVHVEFAVLSLEPLGALALVGSDEVLALRAVLARSRVALIDLRVAVGAHVSVQAVAAMGVADVLASSIVAEFLRFHP